MFFIFSYDISANIDLRIHLYNGMHMHCMLYMKKATVEFMYIHPDCKRPNRIR